MQSAAGWCEQAADAGVELLVFPEAWNNTGYDTELFESELPSAEDLSWLAPLQQAVDRTGIVVLLNAALSAPSGSKRLTTIVLTTGVDPRPVYDKQHLFPLEVGTFTAAMPEAASLGRTRDRAVGLL
ncbi:putative amidohydrolase [Psychromicrobium silvestre]|uniref:Putative amidohydrolase n=1 Tax=Psychromicrobium silvestre TaxID=1645614 RepID=A0A7Y9LQS4_9MICC|nr:nitrilase-related carbon-nitrogen hydrolase [Psychromicrobium silvestre]NYE93880.1 putative amidohydrolase [Psychromicrobium silvestre]